jgi:enamine deaminase RidA (YjgF/YER057c/UK114 family)
MPGLSNRQAQGLHFFRERHDMTDITRLHTGHRMSQIVIHGDTIYLAGQVGAPGASVTDQARTCLEQVDALLAEAGSDKTRILQCTIWLADMADFAEMNAVWDAWVAPGHTPARACGEAKLATPDYRVEFMVTAARS